MKQETRRELINGFCSAFIESNDEDTDKSYVPSFLYNDRKAGKKLLSAIEDELLNCTKFDISVAFITMSGIEPLLLTLKELEKKGVQGRILTTDYLAFSDPAALRKLAEFSNIKVKLYTCTTDTGFHTKGYIFQNADVYHIILGSSNWTAKALTVNHEWNTRLISGEEGPFIEELRQEFDTLWKESKPLEKVIDSYETLWSVAKRVREKAQELGLDGTEDQRSLKPNMMQKEFVKRISELYESKENRALLISATGTGKTYAAAFAVQKIKPENVLFIVHRGQIAKQARRSFKRILGKQYRSYGLLSGTSKDYDSDCLFATMQTMSQKETLDYYDPDRFNLIIIDEVHRTGAESYKKIMEYFKPRFWLGMTASPDRPDGFDIYKLFDHNIAYEIRLETALSYDLLCPFHYFGISDINIDDGILKNPRAFNLLTSNQRIKHIIDMANFYGHSGNRVQGLIFCSRVDECEELSSKFNNLYKKNGQKYKTIALSAKSSSVEEREDAIKRLTQAEDNEDSLDYIFTVDLFNEGVDIPEVNQVILLRPTQSSIIFIQQLGRGLRKAENKDFVVVLDFIGNYQNNFLIPIALSGDQSYNKDNMRRFMAVGRKLIPGASTIHFDEITRKRIYKAISAANTQSVNLINDAYVILRNKLGRIPNLMDFEKYNSIDVIKIFEKFGSYYSFLKKREKKDFKTRISSEAEEMLCFFSKELGRAQRISEVIVLENILANKGNLLKHLRLTLSNEYGIKLSLSHERNVFTVLTNGFQANEGLKKNHSNCIFIESDGKGDWRASALFKNIVSKNPALRDFLKDLVAFMKDRYQKHYSAHYKDTDLTLNEKYTYADVCRLLNWTKNINAQNIGGYRYDAETKTLPVFINYHKDPNNKNGQNYKDRFVSNPRITALSKANRKPNSKDADHIYKRKPEDKDNRIYLFVRRDKKDKGEAQSFYFLGEVFAQEPPKEVILGNNQPAFEINYRLDVPVRQDIYDYLTAEIEE